MKCNHCKKEFTPSFHARNVKYCSIKCRNKVNYIRLGGADYQRAYLEKQREKDGRERIKCELCGKFYRQVGSHVYMTHGVLARDYREAFGFDVKRGQLPADLRELFAQQCRENGTVDNLKKGIKHWFKKGQAGLGTYHRSDQTMRRLKTLSHLFLKTNKYGNTNNSQIIG